MTDIATSMAQEQIKELRAEIEGLRAEVAILRTTETAEVERLRTILQKLDWKSIDKDNMEYSCRVPYNVMDEIRRAVKQKP